MGWMVGKPRVAWAIIDQVSQGLGPQAIHQFRAVISAAAKGPKVTFVKHTNYQLKKGYVVLIEVLPGEVGMSVLGSPS